MIWKYQLIMLSAEWMLWLPLCEYKYGGCHLWKWESHTFEHLGHPVNAGMAYVEHLRYIEHFVNIGQAYIKHFSRPVNAGKAYTEHFRHPVQKDKANFEHYSHMD